MQSWNLGTVVSAQPVPKTAYRSGCRDEHNRQLRCDSNLGPLIPQWDALTSSLTIRPLLWPVDFEGLIAANS